MVSITPELQALLDNKLYHQFTEGVIELFKAPENAKKAELIDFFKTHIAARNDQLNLVKYANILRLALEGLKPSDAIETLQLYEAKLAKDKEAEILYICIKGRLLAAVGKSLESYETLNEAKEKLNDILGADLSVLGAYHLALAHLARYRQNWADVYAEGTLYLAYISLNSIQHSDILDIAELISVAALAAPRVVDVGEFARHAAVSVLKGDAERGWLAELVEAFSTGQISTFNAAVVKYDGKLASHPVLSSLRGQLTEKITLLALVDLVFNQPSKERSLTFQQISHHCRIDFSEVEHLIIRAVARGLVKAVVDEVNQIVRFKWVKPQIIGTTQINSIKVKLEDWANSAERLVAKIGEMNPTEAAIGALIKAQ